MNTPESIQHWQHEVGAYPISTVHMAMLLEEEDKLDDPFRGHLVEKVLPRYRREGRYLEPADFCARLAMWVLGGELPP